VRVALHDPELARPIAERELHIAPGGIVELRVADLGG
jgi:hypothetical protein